MNIKQELPINGQIREKEVQLIGANGEKLGVMSTRDALEKAEEENLDLVLVSPNAKPAVCKIMNYGKYKFEQAKKEKEAKKKQKVLEIKELRVTPNIEEHDFEFKSKNARKFLEDGNKVKITVRFRGREVNNSKAGENVLNKFLEKLEDVKKLEKANAERLDQQHLNMEQLVTILHDNFEVSIGWDGDNIVLDREV